MFCGIRGRGAVKHGLFPTALHAWKMPCPLPGGLRGHSCSAGNPAGWGAPVKSYRCFCNVHPIDGFVWKNWMAAWAHRQPKAAVLGQQNVRASNISGLGGGQVVEGGWLELP